MTRWAGPYRLTLVAAPMAVWALHFVLVYSLAGLGCEHGWHLRNMVAANPLTWSLILATVVALGLLAGIGWHAWRSWRVQRDRSEDGDGDGDGTLARRQRFMSLATAVLALLAAIAVSMTAIPVFMLPPCL